MTVRGSLPNRAASADASVVVTVVDVNDNAPQFLHPQLEAQITEEDGRNLPRDILTVRTFTLKIFYEICEIDRTQIFCVSVSDKCINVT